MLLSLTNFIKTKAIEINPVYKDPLKFDQLLNIILDDKEMFHTWNIAYDSYVKDYLKKAYKKVEPPKPLRYLNRKEQ